MKKSFFKEQLTSIIRNDEEATNDTLGAYPERLHVSAFPERRYLKTSRVLAIMIFLSVLLNIALGFVYMKLAGEADANIYNPAGGAHLYQVDLFNKKIKPVELTHIRIPAVHLMSQNLLEEYIIQRFEITPYFNEMLLRWGDEGFVSLTSGQKVGVEEEEAFRQQRKAQRGLVEDVYIYSVRQISGMLYEIVFDVFTTKKTRRGEKQCFSIERDKAWLSCLREKATQIKRYRAIARVSYTIIPRRTREQILKNPYHFQVVFFALYNLPIRQGDPWTDVDVLAK